MAYGKPSGKEMRLRMAQEAMQITANRCYPVHGDIIPLEDNDYSQAIYLGEASLAFISEQMETQIYELPEFRTQYLVTKEDALDAAAGRDDLGPTLVMSFANAHVPGGGFLFGSRGQEESLCRNSTLYTSLCSAAGVLLYLHNNMMQLPVESDCMSLSPSVAVFRAGDGSLLEKPFMTSVVSVPAPDRRERALDVAQDVLDTVMIGRIDKMIQAAAYYGYRTLVLGAWGCGAFRHESERVARYFREVLVERGYGRLFARVVFAIHDRHSDEKLDAFRAVFADLLEEDGNTAAPMPPLQHKAPLSNPKSADRPDIQPEVHVNEIDVEQDLSEQALYCRLENRMITVNRARCGADCPHFVGIGQGNAIECIWPDVQTEEGQRVTRLEDQESQMQRVQQLIADGVLDED